MISPLKLLPAFVALWDSVAAQITLKENNLAACRDD